MFYVKLVSKVRNIDHYKPSKYGVLDFIEGLMQNFFVKIIKIHIYLESTMFHIEWMGLGVCAILIVLLQLK